MITLTAYNDAWPKLFEEEKIKIQQALGGCIANIEHIGSTAIPGIYAKPIIDILIGVSDINQFTEQDINKIKSLGYQYYPHFEKEFPHRRYFQKSDAMGNRTHQIHLVNYPSAWWAKHILFRDYLRNHTDFAKYYESHKLMLAKKFDDTMSYSIAKTEVCEKINKQAYFDFTLHKPHSVTERLNGYIPQLACFEAYKTMCRDPDFIHCFGIELSDDFIKKIIEKCSTCWDKYGYGPYMWFDKKTQNFVGKGGLNHTEVEGKPEIELTYSLSKYYWGRNLAVEIGQQVIDDGFNIFKLKDIVCFTLATNIQSLRVMEKLGFQYEKDFVYYDLLHKLYRLKGNFYDIS